MPSSPSQALAPIRATRVASWSKRPDLDVHARVVDVDGSLSLIEFRDHILSTKTDGRGVWLADSPVARDVLDAVTSASAEEYTDTPVPGTVLGVLPKAPAIDLVVSAVEVDGEVVCELRELRGGVPGRGYWIPWDQRAHKLALVAASHAEFQREAS